MEEGCANGSALTLSDSFTVGKMIKTTVYIFETHPALKKKPLLWRQTYPESQLKKKKRCHFNSLAELIFRVFL